MRKLQRRWGTVPGVLVKAEAMVQAKEIFYEAVLQTFLIYGIEILFITGTMMKVMEEFRHLISWRISGKTSQQVGAEEWGWPLVEEDLEAAGLCPMQ